MKRNETGFWKVRKLLKTKWQGRNRTADASLFKGCLPTRLSGSESGQVTLGERLTRDHLWDHFGSFRPFSPLQCSRIVPRSGALLGIRYEAQPYFAGVLVRRSS